MADGRPLLPPEPLPVVPQAQPDDVGLQIVPLVQPSVPLLQPDAIPPLNWSHCKYEFA